MTNKKKTERKLYMFLIFVNTWRIKKGRKYIRDDIYIYILEINQYLLCVKRKELSEKIMINSCNFTEDVLITEVKILCNM